MDLKEQFKKTLDILLIHDDDCEYEENICESVCQNKAKHAEGCISNCNECRFPNIENYEFAVFNHGMGGAIYYSFAGMGDGVDIHNINNEEDMYEELRYVQEKFANKKYFDEADYHEKLKELEEYARWYFKEIIEKYFSMLTSIILPIRFHSSLTNMKEHEEKTVTGGEYSTARKQHIIDIYHVGIMSIEGLKQSIRHEILHYALDMCDCKHEDDKGIFTALAKIEDAQPYVTLNETEQKICDDFLDVVENLNIISAVYKKCNVKEENYKILDLIMLAGSKDKEKQDYFPIVVNQYREIVQDIDQIIKDIKLASYVYDFSQNIYAIKSNIADIGKPVRFNTGFTGIFAYKHTGLLKTLSLNLQNIGCNNIKHQH